MQTDKYQEVRENWLKSPEAKFYSPRGNKVIADFWISLMQQRDRELVEKIKEKDNQYLINKYGATMLSGALSKGYKDCQQDIVSLIQSNNKENGK